MVALPLQSPKPDVVISPFYITRRQIARVNACVCVCVHVWVTSAPAELDPLKAFFSYLVQKYSKYSS